MFSIRAQLTALFVVPLVLATGLVAFVAQRIARNAVEQYAVSILQNDADAKRDAITALLRRENASSASFLETTEANCAISGRSNLVCAREALEQFAVRQQATCVVMQTRAMTLAAHRCHPEESDAEGPFVLGQTTYRITQSNADLGVKILDEFAIDDLRHIIAGGDYGVGSSALLLNRTGQVLAAAPVGVPIWEGVTCSSTSAQDSLGRRLIVRSTAVPMLGGCVVSEVPEQQALEPSTLLRRASWLMIAGFVIAALLLSYGAATLITVPLARLTRRASLFRQGDLDTAIPISGPTEVRKLGLALADAAAGLKAARQTDLERERAEAETGMAAALAHQINNPLTSVISALALFQNRLKNEQDRKLLGFATEDAHRIASVTRQLLALYRGPAQVGLVDISQLLQAIVEQYRPELKRRGITVCSEFSSVSVGGFRNELQQALANIFQNAVAAAAPGSEIVVRCARTRERRPPFRFGARIIIHNSGATIERSLKEKLTRPFVSSSSVRGKGLGLWAANASVQKHHGRLRVRCGTTSTTVSIFLPHVTTIAA